MPNTSTAWMSGSDGRLVNGPISTRSVHDRWPYFQHVTHGDMKDVSALELAPDSVSDKSILNLHTSRFSVVVAVHPVTE